MRPARIPEFARAGEEAVYKALPALRALLDDGSNQQSAISNQTEPE
jgi:hypothetical protein